MKTFEFDWKNFTLAQLEEKLKGTDVRLDHDTHPAYSSFWKKNLNTPLTISDYGSGEIYKGSENIYLDISVFMQDENINDELKLKIYTKDDHETLKAIAKSFVEKMKTGGMTKSNGYTYLVEFSEGEKPAQRKKFSGSNAKEAAIKFASSKKAYLYSVSPTGEEMWIADFSNEGHDVSMLFKRGGMTSKQYAIVAKTMGEFKDGKLHSSSGDLVTDRYQAIAIALSKAERGKFEQGGSTEEMDEVPEGTSFSEEWQDVIRPYFESRGLQIHWLSEDDNYINYNVTDSKTGKTTQATEVMKKKLWNLPAKEVAEEMYNWVQEKYISYFKQGGSTEFWSKETKKHAFFPTGKGFIYFYRGTPVAVVYNIKNDIEDFWGVWVPEEKITDVKTLLDQMLNETNSQKGYFISADDFDSAVQEMKDNFNDSFAQGGSTKKYDIYDKIIILSVYDSRIDGLEGAIDFYENNHNRTSEYAVNKHSKLESLYRKKAEAEEAKKHFSVHNEIVDLEDSVDAKIFYNELNELPKTSRGRSLFQSGESGEKLYDRLLNLFDRVEAEIESKYPHLELYAKGGIVISKISEIPNIEERINEGSVTYRGLGSGKKANEYIKVAGEPVTLIKVDGKEYAITDTEFRQLNWDEEKGAWKGLIKFAAPKRKFAEGGITSDEFEERLLRAKTEIVEDMLMGELPVSVKTFRELHFYVDANAYGGFFEPGYEMSEGFVFENSIQEALDQWIRKGGHVQMYLAQEALENKYETGGVTSSRREGLRAKLEKLKDIWHDFALMGDSEYIIKDLLIMHLYLSDQPMKSLENQADDEGLDWNTYNEAWNEIFTAFTNASDEQIQALIDNHESYIDESLADQEEYAHGGNVPSYSEIKPEYAKGGYVKVPGDVKITGIYEFKTKDKVRTLMVNGFERENDDSDSLYLDDEDENKSEIGSVIVKNSAMRKMAKGNPVTAITSRSKEKGTLTRIKDRW